MINNILRSRNTLIVIFIVALVTQLKIFSNVQFSSSALDTVVTFLSVIFGFYITSLAIFVTSQYVRELYKTTDSNNKERTLLHTLLGNYKFGLLTNLVSIIYFVALILFFNDGNLIKMGDTPYSLILPLLVTNIFYHYLMLSDLIKIIVQESKRK